MSYILVIIIVGIISLIIAYKMTDSILAVTIYGVYIALIILIVSPVLINN